MQSVPPSSGTPSGLDTAAERPGARRAPRSSRPATIESSRRLVERQKAQRDSFVPPSFDPVDFRLDRDLQAEAAQALETGGLGPTVDTEEQLEVFVDRLFGSGRGFVCTPVGQRCFYTPTGSYEFGRWVQNEAVFWRWPREADDLIDFVLEEADRADVYICPVLLDGRDRKEDSCLPARHAWADLDWPWSQERIEHVIELLGAGSFLVDSGSGAHLYVALDDESPAAQLKAVNQGLARHLEGDSKFSPCSVLRPPGTYNRKALPLGGDPLPVRVVGL